MDTNHLERALRVIPLGRRNWLFTWTELGARHVGIVQSLLATCRLHEINPYDYLVDVLQRVGRHPAARVAELTPRLRIPLKVISDSRPSWSPQVMSAAEAADQGAPFTTNPLDGRFVRRPAASYQPSAGDYHVRLFRSVVALGESGALGGGKVFRNDSPLVFSSIRWLW